MLEKRTKEFAFDVVRISKRIPFSVENKVLKTQVTKSATSIGANYREANRSSSKADFVYKIKICEGEANETIYWLELIQMLELDDNIILEKALQEAKEILAILSCIIKKLS